MYMYMDDNVVFGLHLRVLPKITSNSKPKIAFIGNCQMIALCSFLQLLLKNTCDVKWCLYGDEFKQYIEDWSNKQDKIIDYDKSIQYVKSCDVIIYQQIVESKSPISMRRIYYN